MKNIKNIVLTTIVIVCGLFCGYCEANATTTTTANTTTEKAIKAYTLKRYGKGYKTKIQNADMVTDKGLASRKGKNLVYVDRYHVRVDKSGIYGTVTDKGAFYKCRIRLAKRLKPNTATTTYLIYNPNSSFTDDVIALATDGKVKTIR